MHSTGLLLILGSRYIATCTSDELCCSTNYTSLCTVYCCRKLRWFCLSPAKHNAPAAGQWYFTTFRYEL